MDITDMWQLAMKSTKVRRKRLASLETFEETRLPYILVSAHPRGPAQSNVRQGHVAVGKPRLFLPEHHPQFEGFDFDQLQADENTIQTMMYVRGIRLPSMKFKNVRSHMLYDGTVDDAVAQYARELARAEDVVTGLITGQEDVWPFALLFYVSMLIAKNLPKDIERLLEEIRENPPQDST